MMTIRKMMKWRAGTRWVSWPRLAGVAVTIVLFWLIFQKVDARILWGTLCAAHVPYILTALMLYGMALVLGGIRWHLSLTATGSAVHSGASIRLLFIGHFYFVALFGAAGGDVAKSLLYARYFRRDLPQVIAAAPLDRMLGTIGAFLVAGLSFGLAFGTQGFQELEVVRWDSVRGWWMVVGSVMVMAGVVALVCRPRSENPWKRGWRAFWLGGRALMQRPVAGRKAILVAILHQLTVYAVFSANLAAVRPEPLPWLEMAWTIPAITMLSCFPVSFAGAGVREVAAVTLLGLYGIPQEQAVAAAMLTLLVKLAWALVGAGVFWKEEVRQARGASVTPVRSISVVIPAYNEEQTLLRTLQHLQRIPEVSEIIVVDGGSLDRTREVAEGLGCRVVRADRASRGAQLREGAVQAKGDAVLLLHADTWLPPDAGRALLDCLSDTTVVGGGFWKVFEDTPMLLLGSRFKCAVRFWIWRRVAGDQALFVRRDVLESIGGVPAVPLMEEFELCRMLRRRGHLALAGATVLTSARRFNEFGIVRTYLLMGRIHALYRLGTPLEELRRQYEKRIRPES